MQECWAKDAFLEARKRRLMAALDAERILDEKNRAQYRLPRNLNEMRTMELYLDKLECDYENQMAVVHILANDEQTAHAEWIETRKRLKAMERLYEIAKAEWQLAEDRKAQKDLDEWAALRRAA